MKQQTKLDIASELLHKIVGCSIDVMLAIIERNPKMGDISKQDYDTLNTFTYLISNFMQKIADEELNFRIKNIEDNICIYASLLSENPAENSENLVRAIVDASKRLEIHHKLCLYLNKH